MEVAFNCSKGTYNITKNIKSTKEIKLTDAEIQKIIRNYQDKNYNNWEAQRKLFNESLVWTFVGGIGFPGLIASLTVMPLYCGISELNMKRKIRKLQKLIQ